MLLSDRTAELLGVEPSEQVHEILLAVEVDEDRNKKKRKPWQRGTTSEGREVLRRWFGDSLVIGPGRTSVSRFQPQRVINIEALETYPVISECPRSSAPDSTNRLPGNPAPGLRRPNPTCEAARICARNRSCRGSREIPTRAIDLYRSPRQRRGTGNRRSR
jgi:hypothetical protein